MKMKLIALSCLSFTAFAQLTSRFEVFVSNALVDEEGNTLEGTSPAAAAFGFTMVPGCRIELLNAGPDGIANPPQTDGSPGGDDTLIKVTAIGKGIAPSQSQSGSFAISFPIGDLNGVTSLYARVYNAPTLAGATHWGQSGVKEISGERLDLGSLGLWGTSQISGVDSTNTDSDGDGATDWEEAVAGTAGNSNTDRPEILSEENGVMTLKVAAGRQYVIYRNLQGLEHTAAWEVATVVAPQTAAGNVQVTLPDLPEGQTKVYYKFEVE